MSCSNDHNFLYSGLIYKKIHMYFLLEENLYFREILLYEKAEQIANGDFTDSVTELMAIHLSANTCVILTCSSTAK